jgi:hypothetical protein
MSWDEAFAERYEEWSAPMTADVPFYVALAREADGPIVELAVGNGRVAGDRRRLRVQPPHRRADRRAAPGRSSTAHRHLRRRGQPERPDVEALYGGFERKPLEDSSEEYVFVATRS